MHPQETKCPYCNPKDNPDQTILLQNEHCLFLQKPQAVLIGSGLIVPREHRQNVFDLTREEWNATYDLLHEVKKVLDEQHQPQGYNVGWNCGETGGQTVFHAHLHVIPRYEDEPLAGKGIRHFIKQRDNMRKGVHLNASKT